jgi:hypothetical protein
VTPDRKRIVREAAATLKVLRRASDPQTTVAVWNVMTGGVLAEAVT